ncbi:MAG: helix-turn-helix transcriptional regulator [Clostridia bacterium]|nr:helix-turn-helix transcriptional regulator [Clostridia bacterium]
MTFYETLSELMNKNKVTAKQLSETLKIGKNQFKYWKDKGNIPNGDTLIALADYFNCSVDYLLGRAEKQKAAVSVADESDNNKNRLMHNYNKMNDKAQEHIADYSDFMLTNPQNLKNNPQNSKMNA